MQSCTEQAATHGEISPVVEAGSAIDSRKAQHVDRFPSPPLSVFPDWSVDLLRRHLPPPHSWAQADPESHKQQQVQMLREGCDAEDQIETRHELHVHAGDASDLGTGRESTVHSDSGWNTDLLRLPLSAVFSARAKHQLGEPYLPPTTQVQEDQGTQRPPGAPLEEPSVQNNTHPEATATTASPKLSTAEQDREDWGILALGPEHGSPAERSSLHTSPSGDQGFQEECEEETFFQILEELIPGTHLMGSSQADTPLKTLWCTPSSQDLEQPGCMHMPLVRQGSGTSVAGSQELPQVQPRGLQQANGEMGGLWAEVRQAGPQSNLQTEGLHPGTASPDQDCQPTDSQLLLCSKGGQCQASAHTAECRAPKPASQAGGLLDSINLAALEKLGERMDASRSRGPAQQAEPTAGASSALSTQQSIAVRSLASKVVPKRGREAQSGSCVSGAMSTDALSSHRPWTDEALFGVVAHARRGQSPSLFNSGPETPGWRRGPSYGMPAWAPSPMFFRPGPPGVPGDGSPVLVTPVPMGVRFPQVELLREGQGLAGDKAYNQQLRGWLLQLAHAVSTGNQAEALQCAHLLGGHVHPHGTPIQRLGVYLMAAVTSRLRGYSTEDNVQETYALQADPHRFTPSPSVVQAGQVKIWPMYQFILATLMGLVVDSVGADDRVHILDFSCCAMWPPIIEELARLASLRESTLHVKFTACVAPQGHPWGNQRVMPPQALHRILRRTCQKPHVKLQFQAISVLPDRLQPDMLMLDPRDALVVYYGTRLTSMVDMYATSPGNLKDCALKAARSLNPRVVGLVEWSANLQHPFFMPRFQESFDLMLAFFEAFEALSPWSSPGRREVEELMMGHELKFLLACEGPHNFVRYELYEQLMQRMLRLGFRGVPVSRQTHSDIARSLTWVPKEFQVEKHRTNGCQVHWKGRPLLSASAWCPQQGPVAPSSSDVLGQDFGV